MALLKFKNNGKKWHALYADALENRLRRDLNLSDLFDAATARVNLGLFGAIGYDKITPNNPLYHHHPIYDEKIGELSDTLGTKIQKEIDDRIRELRYEADIREINDKNLADELDEQVTSLRTDMEKEDTQLEKLITLNSSNVRLESQRDLLLKAEEIYNKLWVVQELLSDDIKTEARTRYDEDNKLLNGYTAAINKEATDRRTEVRNEKEARVNSDNTLRAAIENTKDLIAQERKDRATSEEYIHARIKYILSIAIPAEAGARMAKDDWLYDYVNGDGGKAYYGNKVLRDLINEQSALYERDIYLIRDFINYGTVSETGHSSNRRTRGLDVIWNGIWDNLTDHNTVASETANSYPNAYSIYMMIRALREWLGWTTATSNTDETKKAKIGNEALYNYLWKNQYTTANGTTKYPMNIEQMLENVRMFIAMSGTDTENAATKDAVQYTDTSNKGADRWGNRSLFKYIWGTKDSTTKGITSTPYYGSGDARMSVYEMIQRIREFTNTGGTLAVSTTQNQYTDANYQKYGNLALYNQVFMDSPSVPSGQIDSLRTKLIRNYRAGDNEIRNFIGMNKVIETGSNSTDQLMYKAGQSGSTTLDDTHKKRYGNEMLHKYIWGDQNVSDFDHIPHENSNDIISIYSMIQNIHQFIHFNGSSNIDKVNFLRDEMRLKYGNIALYSYIWGTNQYTSADGQTTTRPNTVWGMLTNICSWIGLVTATGSKDITNFNKTDYGYYGNQELFKRIFGDKSEATGMSKDDATISNLCLKSLLFKEIKDFDNKIRDFIGMSAIGDTNRTTANTSNYLDATGKAKIGNQALYNYIWGSGASYTSGNYPTNIHQMLKNIATFVGIDSKNNCQPSETEKNTHSNVNIRSKLKKQIWGNKYTSDLDSTPCSESIYGILGQIAAYLGGSISTSGFSSTQYKPSDILTYVHALATQIASCLDNLNDQLESILGTTVWQDQGTTTVKGQGSVSTYSVTFPQFNGTVKTIFNTSDQLVFPNGDTFWLGTV